MASCLTTNEMFRRLRARPQTFAAFGFTKKTGGWECSTPIVGGTFSCVVTINKAGARPSRTIPFDADRDLVLHKSFLARHENGLTCTAFCGKEPVLTRTYYSVGGGAVVEDSEWGKENGNCCPAVPYPYRNAADLLEHCERTGLPLSSVMMENECALRPREQVKAFLLRI